MKALVLASGGVDSSTCLALAVKKYCAEEVTALALRYGQKHIRELESARKISAYYHVRLIELDLAPIFCYNSDCALLNGSSAAIPLMDYAEQLKHTGGKPVTTYVPFRNGLFLSTAASIALSLHCDVIYYGAHRDDAAGNAYPDCSEAFNSAMGQAIYLGSGNTLRIEAPFIDKNKSDIVREGLRLGVPYQFTWSCYTGGNRPCGVCGTCRDRAAAFAANNVSDPALEF